MTSDPDREETVDSEVSEIDAELVAVDEEPVEEGGAYEVETEPADDSSDEFLEGIFYAEVPNPFEAGVLFAHDPQALSLALADPGTQVRTVVSHNTDAPGGSEGGLGAIRDIEELALQRAKIDRKSVV